MYGSIYLFFPPFVHNLTGSGPFYPSDPTARYTSSVSTSCFQERNPPHTRNTPPLLSQP